MDANILSVLADRDVYEQYARFVKPSSVGAECWDVFVAMGDWFKHNPSAPTINWPYFGAWFALVRHAKMDTDRLAARKALISTVETVTPDPSAIESLLHGLAKRDYAAQIAEVALKVSDGDYSLGFDSIMDLIGKHDKAVGKLDKLSKGVGEFSVAVMEEAVSPGLRWRLRCLNESLGDFRKGDFIVLGKRPDTGGTTFLASEASFMAGQLPEEKRVLWINNEEAGNKVRRRIVQSALGITTSAMDADLKGAFDKYIALMGGHKDRIMVYDDAYVHVKDVDKLVEKYNPGLIIFDQLWKVHGFDGEGNEVARQTLLFNWARELAKAYSPVITVHQAGGAAEGVKWIGMKDLYGSQTGIQGEADAIITIGRLPETGDARYIYVPKNKMQGTPGGMRNMKAEVKIQPNIARFEEF